MAYSKLFYVVKPCRKLALISKGGIIHCKCLVLSSYIFRETCIFIIGELFNVDFVYDVLCPLKRSLIISPAIRISSVQVYYHTSLSIYSTGFSIRVCGNVCLPLYLKGEVIVFPTQVLIYSIFPYSPVTKLHRYDGFRLSCTSIVI